MTKRLSPYRLGATLYMPATRSDIAKSVLSNEIEGLRSIVICLEDAVSEADVPAAMDNLKQYSQRYVSAKAEGQGAEWPLVFIRPRHTEMGQYLTTSLDLSAGGRACIAQVHPRLPASVVGDYERHTPVHDADAGNGRRL
ncbi:HpcH/HpaI aldolase/citrate lyase family protein [Rahnella sikkimica]|uniref:HpcH/HpaI aldolase/citrate lyase family protein n=1 Tax=Rahnella sikkimica TaxID=1805933 RepID=UPI0026B0C253